MIGPILLAISWRALSWSFCNSCTPRGAARGGSVRGLSLVLVRHYWQSSHDGLCLRVDWCLRLHARLRVCHDEVHCTPDRPPSRMERGLVRGLLDRPPRPWAPGAWKRSRAHGGNGASKPPSQPGAPTRIRRGGVQVPDSRLSSRRRVRTADHKCDGVTHRVNRHPLWVGGTPAARYESGRRGRR